MSLMSTQQLAGTTALVTGASRGSGRAIAIALAKQGAHIVGVARDRPRLEGLRAPGTWRMPRPTWASRWIPAAGIAAGSTQGDPVLRAMATYCRLLGSRSVIEPSQVLKTRPKFPPAGNPALRTRMTQPRDVSGAPRSPGSAR